MIRRIASRVTNRDDGGFTLIELMVVVLIIGILIAVMLPTFLGARPRAQDKSEESTLRNAVAAAKTFFTDGSTYAGFTGGVAGTAHGIEPSLNWQLTGVDPALVNGGMNVAVIQVATVNDVLLIGFSGSGKYFCIHDSSQTGTSYNDDLALANVNTVANCAANQWP